MRFRCPGNRAIIGSHWSDDVRRGLLHLGTSGFHYPHWRGLFYPRELSPDAWLPFYARHFGAVELNSTFYRLPEAEIFEHWRAATASELLFALKFSRYGSHLKRLREPERTVQPFVARARHLGAQLGPVLVQLPPHWHADAGRLDAFLAETPRDLRWAVEVRDPSWLVQDVYAVLAAHGAALCLHDLLPAHPRRLTADWVYLRFHGDHYRGSYSGAQLQAAADEIGGWLAQGIDCYAFFNNDQNGYAVANARDLGRLLGNEPALRAQSP